MSRRIRGLLVALVLLGVAAFTVIKIQGMLQRGEPVFWLAELWAPAAVLSIGLVTCIEFLLPQAPLAVAVPVLAASKPSTRKKARK